MRLLLLLNQLPDLRPPLISVPVVRVLEGQRIKLIVEFTQGLLHMIPEPHVIAAEQGLSQVGTTNERRLQSIVELILNVEGAFISFFCRMGLDLNLLICFDFVHFL
jgi:hypothetical protein